MKVEIRSRDLDSGGILSACRAGAIPVNGIVPAAITAHQIAYAYFRARGGNDNKRMAVLTLRTVILAMAPDLPDSQRQLDYLAGLPIEAWDVDIGMPAAKVRQATLASLTRSIIWRAEP